MKPFNFLTNFLYEHESSSFFNSKFSLKNTQTTLSDWKFSWSKYLSCLSDMIWRKTFKQLFKQYFKEIIVWIPSELNCAHPIGYLKFLWWSVLYSRETKVRDKQEPRASRKYIKHWYMEISTLQLRILNTSIMPKSEAHWTCIKSFKHILHWVYDLIRKMT